MFNIIMEWLMRYLKFEPFFQKNLYNVKITSLLALFITLSLYFLFLTTNKFFNKIKFDMDTTVSTDFEDLSITVSETAEVLSNDSLFAVDGFFNFLFLLSSTIITLTILKSFR